MQIIEAGNHNGKWICGVLLDEEKANKLYQKIKNNISEPYLVPKNIECYPLYALRVYDSAFIYMSHAELIDYFKNFDMPDEDGIHGELFIIEEDYFTNDHDLMCELLKPSLFVTNGFIHYLRTSANVI